MNIESALESFIVEEIMLARKETKIDPDESLLSSGILDSLGLLRLVAFLEERFGVAVEGDEVIPENFETIDSIKNFIQHKI
jgi:acyl carrier protein